MDIPHEDHREWLAADKNEYGYGDPSDEEIIIIVLEETDNTTEEEEQDNSLPKVSHVKHWKQFFYMQKNSQTYQ